MHLDHVQGHQRKKTPFLTNGTEKKANNDRTNEQGNKKIVFIIVMNTTSSFYELGVSMRSLSIEAGPDLFLEMVKGTRIPWNAGEKHTLGLSGLIDLYQFAPWTYSDLNVHNKILHKIGKPYSKCND